MRPSKIPNTAWWTWPADGWAASLVLFFILGFGFPAVSFSAPYVKSGEVIVSVDDIADIWLNGVPIVKDQQITMPTTGGIGRYGVNPCLFKPENRMALRCTDIKPTMAMIAFILKARLSDGTVLLFTSRDTEKIKAFYVGNPRSPEPPAWWMPDFNDQDWEKPNSQGPFSTYLSLIDDSDAPFKPLYIFANENSGKTLVDGERHLFRGAFRWDIDPSPDCVSPTPTKEPIRSTAPVIPPQPVVAPPPSPTFTMRPVVFSPTKTPIPPQPTATAPIFPTATRWIPKPTATPPPIPTATPWRARITPIRPLKPTPTAPWVKVESTPTVHYNGDVMVTGPRRWVPTTPTFTPPPRLPRVTPIPTPFQHLDAMVFDQLPVAIHVKLADGPGDYTVDLYSETGMFLKRVFEKKAPGNLEDWVEWEGKLGNRWAPSGTYLFVCRKETRELKRIWIVLKTKP